MSKHKRKTLAFLLRLTVVAVLTGAFVAGPHTPGRAESHFPGASRGRTCNAITRPASNANSPWITTASVSQIPMRCRKLIRRASGAASPISPSALKMEILLSEKTWQRRAEPTPREILIIALFETDCQQLELDALQVGNPPHH